MIYWLPVKSSAKKSARPPRTSIKCGRRWMTFNQLHGDGGFVQAPLTNPEGLAAQIVEAGRRARAEVP